MQTLKKWEKIDNSNFTFWNSDQLIGNLRLEKRASKKSANAKLHDEEFVFKKYGFWKSNVEVADRKGKIVARIYAQKWYLKSYHLEYDNKMYKLKVRNNPLVELVIQEGACDILSYSLITQDGKVGVSIKSEDGKVPYLFDFLLWFMFEPIASENGLSDETFLMLIA